MFTILLKFAENKAHAANFMTGHKAWIEKGFEEGAFVLVGGIEPKQGGFILARGSDKPAIEARVAEDPFVAENVVTAEILEISPARADDRLNFLTA